MNTRKRYGSYRTALRAKGIRPIPKYDKLRTRKDNPDLDHHVITATKDVGCHG